MKDKTITFTEAELASLSDYIQFNLLDVIRTDVDIDNINWVCNMCRIYEKITEAMGNDNAK